MTTLLFLPSDTFQRCRCSISHLFNSALCKLMTNYPDGFCLWLSSCCFYSSQESKCTRRHATLMSSPIAIALSFSPLSVSSSTTASLSLLHLMVHSNASKRTSKLCSSLQDIPSFLFLLLKPSSGLVYLSSLQLHSWASCSNPGPPTLLLRLQRLHQGTTSLLAPKPIDTKWAHAARRHGWDPQLKAFSWERQWTWRAQWHSESHYKLGTTH